jgi:hypothetical protein
MNIDISTNCYRCKARLNFCTFDESEGEPFNIDDKEMWVLIKKDYSGHIKELRKEFRGMAKKQKAEIEAETGATTENEYIADQLKITTAEGVYFVRCPRCHHYAAYYIISD